MVKWEKIDSNKVSMEIEVNQEIVNEGLKKAYLKVVKKVSVPGFRKGKVPRSVLEAKFGPEVLYEEALEILIPKAYDDAVKEEELNPINQPQFDLVQMEKGKPLIFKAVVEVKPEVILPEYKGVKIEKKVKEVTEAEVDRYLENLQKQHARLVAVEDENVSAEKGDMVVMDFKGYVDGELFPGGEAEGHSLELGSNSFIPGFEDQLVGVKNGEEREVKVTFPEDYREESLAGKEALFEIIVKEIKRKETPELNDDFAQEVSDFDTLEEFKVETKNKLKESEESRALKEMEDQLIQKISKDVEVEVPKVLVEREQDRIVSEMEHFLRMQGMTMEQYTQLTQKTAADMREENKEEAEKRVKANLTLDAIIEKEGITAEEDEVNDRVKKFAEGYNQDPEKVKEMFATQGRLGVIEDEVKFRKAIDFVVKEAEVETVPLEPEEEKGESS